MSCRFKSIPKYKKYRKTFEAFLSEQAIGIMKQPGTVKLKRNVTYNLSDY